MYLLDPRWESSTRLPVTIQLLAEEWNSAAASTTAMPAWNTNATVTTEWFASTVNALLTDFFSKLRKSATAGPLWYVPVFDTDNASCHPKIVIQKPFGCKKTISWLVILLVVPASNFAKLSIVGRTCILELNWPTRMICSTSWPLCPCGDANDSSEEMQADAYIAQCCCSNARIALLRSVMLLKFKMRCGKR